MEGQLFPDLGPGVGDLEFVPGDGMDYPGIGAAGPGKLPDALVAARGPGSDARDTIESAERNAP